MTPDKKHGSNGSGFACMECGHKFATRRAAERALEDGCPECGGCDVDLTTKPRCPDCGVAGETKGHMTCMFPS